MLILKELQAHSVNRQVVKRPH